MDNGLIKGQGLILVTGKKGSGKSHFVTSQIKYIVDTFGKDHQVYADIDGINIPGVEPSPEDWQTVPKNCTIIYDEAQRLPWADNSSAKINSDPRVREMTMIRHENKNIVLITQDPMFIHSALRKLVDVHYHISHPFKDGKPKVFKFAGAMGTIDDKGAYKAHALDTFTHHLDGDTSALYKSVDDDAKHDQKKSIPRKVKIMIGVVVFLILVAIPAGIWGVGKVYGFIAGAEDRGNEMMKDTKNNVETITNGGNAVPAPTGAPEATPTPEDVKQAELLALHQKYLDSYTVEVGQDDAVRPDSIMAMGNKCMAFNRFGDSLNITQDKCFDMLENPDTIPKKRMAKAMTAATAPSVTSEPQRDFINNPPPPIPDNS